MSIVSICVVPGFIAGSPVSPTLRTPLASSSMRFGSPSKPGDREVRGHGVGLKHHELVLLGCPAFVMMKVTWPRGAKVWDRWMNIVGGDGLAQADRDRGRALGRDPEVLVHAHRVVPR